MHRNVLLQHVFTMRCVHVRHIVQTMHGQSCERISTMCDGRPQHRTCSCCISIFCSCICTIRACWNLSPSLPRPVGGGGSMGKSGGICEVLVGVNPPEAFSGSGAASALEFDSDWAVGRGSKVTQVLARGAGAALEGALGNGGSCMLPWRVQLPPASSMLSSPCSPSRPSSPSKQPEYDLEGDGE